MKKSMLAALAAAFLFFACDNGSVEEEDYIAKALELYGNPFIGTWEWIEESYNGSIQNGMRLLFVDNTNVTELVFIRVQWENNRSYTYIYDDTKLIFTNIYNQTKEIPYDFNKSKSLVVEGWKFGKVSLNTNRW